MAKRKPPRAPFTFHGAFASKSDAVARERQVGGFIRPMKVRGRSRFAVLTRNPMAASSAPAAPRNFTRLEDARAYARRQYSGRGTPAAIQGTRTAGGPAYAVTSLSEARRLGWRGFGGA